MPRPPAPPPRNAPEDSGGDRLESWKEIAAYLRRDVTTVRRWEKRESLPVRRHRHAALDTVYAFRSEIDTWRAARRPSVAGPVPLPATITLTGRGPVLETLRDRFAMALKGSRQLVFVSGELGIGKTAVAQAFVRGLENDVWVAEGHSAPLYGSGYPYLPIIDAIGRLCRQPIGREALAILSRRAPSWLNLLPQSLTGSERPSMSDAQVDRLAHELIDALEAMTAIRPLVIVLEDLHWSDNSTVELIARLARRPEAARLMVVGTYRPAERSETQRYLLRVSRELQAHFQLEDVQLPLLTASDVEHYLCAAHGRWHDPSGTARFLHARTEGNPLFLLHFVEALQSAGHLRKDGDEWHLASEACDGATLPATLRGLIENEIDRLLPEDRCALTVASVVGLRFADRMVAHARDADEQRTAETLAVLARRGRFIEAEGSCPWLDGGAAGQFAFVHQFYRDVLYDRAEPGDRARLHRRVAERRAELPDGRSGLAAAERATHFERAGDAVRAAECYAEAAEAALRVNADAEAEECARRGLERVALLDNTVDRHRLELRLRVELATALSNQRTMVHPTVEAAYGDIVAVCDMLGDAPEVVAALLGIARSQGVRGSLETGRQLVARASAVASRLDFARGVTGFHEAHFAFMAGDFSFARSRGWEVLRMGDDGFSSIVAMGFDHRLGTMNTVMWSSCLLGTIEESLQLADAHVHLARELQHPAGRAMAEMWTAPVLEMLGRSERSLELVESAGTVLEAANLPQMLGWLAATRGWLLARRGSLSDGLQLIREGVDLQRRIGLASYQPASLAWLAEGLLLAGEPSQALEAINEGLALSSSSGVRYYEAEMYRLRGEAIAAGATPQPGACDEAEAAFQNANIVARGQSARLLELRAILGLARLFIATRRLNEAARQLTDACEAGCGVCPDLTCALTLRETACP